MSHIRVTIMISHIRPFLLLYHTVLHGNLNPSWGGIAGSLSIFGFLPFLSYSSALLPAVMLLPLRKRSKHCLIWAYVNFSEWCCRSTGMTRQHVDLLNSRKENNDSDETARKKSRKHYYYTAVLEDCSDMADPKSVGKNKLF